ncbi:carboxylesterase/lipase family protein [Lachnoclostridium sp. Marseille-P6806]|uniref:carboxylesterase/lipase family protein n=1 Tax=Lachnoclostridium sp. Marseille-P6806 TaxID=2364793 RepID=UPI0010304FE4|nr:carboxylesterase family protein [Lachnoclostridium sp. Marseille-P6806]
MRKEVSTEYGVVRGIDAADPRITAFKGVPFAAPPIGENRWRAPQPAQSWEGEKLCCQFAPISMQAPRGVGDNVYTREWNVQPDIEMGEDCLYLNVWTGAKSEKDRLPVLVWFFGGGLQEGYTAEMEFDGERIARRGIVVVTVNYRVNVFGFLSHPELTEQQPDAPANFGSLDQKAGILWTIRNIAAFGGDPDNITIAGQSAGGGSVMSQIACLENEGRFRRAVVMSGMIGDPYKSGNFMAPKPLSEAEKNGSAFFDFLGIRTLAEARELDAFYIRDKYMEYTNGDRNRMMFNALDGCFATGNPMEIIQRGGGVKLDAMMAGNTEDEFMSSFPVSSMEDTGKRAEELFGDKAQEFLALAAEQGAVGRAHGIEVAVKQTFLRSAQNGSGAAQYYYRFAPDIPGWDNAGSFHSCDLWFFFETLAKCWRPFVGRHYDLARQMCNYYCNFIKNGDPNGMDADGTFMPEWKAYTAQERNEMEFAPGGAVQRKENIGSLEHFLIENV